MSRRNVHAPGRPIPVPGPDGETWWKVGCLKCHYVTTEFKGVEAMRKVREHSDRENRRGKDQ